MNFSVTPKNVDKIARLLAKIPRFSKGFVAKAIAEYLLGDDSRGLRHYAPWRHVSRRSVYGKSFFSKKQRAAFFAKLNSGEISVPYHRTGKQGAAWHIAGRSTGVRVTNQDASVKWTRGQTALHARMGWQTVKETVNSNLAGALRKGKAAFALWLKSLK